MGFRQSVCYFRRAGGSAGRRGGIKFSEFMIIILFSVKFQIKSTDVSNLLCCFVINSQYPIPKSVFYSICNSIFVRIGASLDCCVEDEVQTKKVVVSF